MTRRTGIVLVALIVALFVAAQAAIVTAHDVCGDSPGHWCGAQTAGVAGAVPGQNPASDAAREYDAEMVAAAWAADHLNAGAPRTVLIAVASVESPYMEEMMPLGGLDR